MTAPGWTPAGRSKGKRKTKDDLGRVNELEKVVAQNRAG